MSEPTATASTDGYPLVHAVNVTKAFHGTEENDVYRRPVAAMVAPIHAVTS